MDYVRRRRHKEKWKEETIKSIFWLKLTWSLMRVNDNQGVNNVPGQYSGDVVICRGSQKKKVRKSSRFLCKLHWLSQIFYHQSLNQFFP